MHNENRCIVGFVGALVMVAFVGSQAVVAEERLATTKYAAHVYPAGDWEYWNAAEGDPGCAPCCYCDTSPPSYAINYTPDDMTWLMAEMQNPQIPSGYAVSSVKVSVMCRFDYDTYEHMSIAARTDGTSWMQETLQIYSTYDCCYRPTNGFDVTALRPNGWTQADLTNLQVRARRDDDWPGRYFRVKAYRVIVEFAPDCNGNLIPDAWDRAHCSGQPWCSDCNGNGVIDVCDISGGTSQDVNGNGIPDECESIAYDVVSLEFTIHNDLSSATLDSDAGALEFTIHNDLSSLTLDADAFGPEFTIHNDLSTGTLGGDAVSREFTVINCTDASPGACCLESGACEYTTEAECTGEWQGSCTFCDPNPCLTYGDMNCDGLVDFDDIPPFVEAITDREAYEYQYPDCQWYAGDCNVDGEVNFDDIAAFVELFIGTG